MSLTREQYIAGLRGVADFYEAHAEIPHPPYESELANYQVRTREEAVRIARIAGNCRKEYDDSYFRIFKEVAPGFFLRFVWLREQVCERVQVGEKIVAAHTLPATEEMFVPEKVEPVYAWKCSESLLKEVAP